MKKESRHILLFDDQCMLCNESVKFVLKHDKKEIFHLISLQSETAKVWFKKQNIHVSMDTLILLKGEKVLSKSTAVLHILKSLDKAYPLLFAFIIIPRFLRDYIYSFIAKRRYHISGKQECCKIKSPNTD